MNSSGSQRFEVQSYIGSDIAQMGELRERPPETAEPVASVYLGGNDYRVYLLSTEKESVGAGKSGWTLWQMGHDYDTGEPLFCRLAAGYPYDGSRSALVAERLLTQVLKDERNEGLLPSPVGVDATGLLSAKDVQRIFAQAFK
jgi:hypothetical protein